ncbi:urease accessory protein UreE [Mesorhizobium sp. CC13]|uniref:urease accessory protein UreE n=1 Tax=Mesorhizobium sp. CC13 TaxID=3029194 RepID=UPI0032656FED
MLRVHTLLGSRGDPALHEAIHHLEHHHAVEFVSIAVGDLDRRRLMARTDKGEEVAITLPRDQKLHDGAVLVLDHHRAVIVRAGEQRWLRFTPRSAIDALELGYHAGNLHWRVRFDGEDLLVAQDGPASGYAARLEPLVAAGRVEMTEEAE